MSQVLMECYLQYMGISVVMAITHKMDGVMDG